MIQEARHDPRRILRQVHVGAAAGVEVGLGVLRGRRVDAGRSDGPRLGRARVVVVEAEKAAATVAFIEIVFHPDLRMVGARAIIAAAGSTPEAPLVIGRDRPTFVRDDGESGGPLADAGRRRSPPERSRSRGAHGGAGA